MFLQGVEGTHYVEYSVPSTTATKPTRQYRPLKSPHLRHRRVNVQWVEVVASRAVESALVGGQLLNNNVFRGGVGGDEWREGLWRAGRAEARDTHNEGSPLE